MPAYYRMQLYKALAESSPREIVQSTVDGLLAARCAYRFARIREGQELVDAEGRGIPRAADVIHSADWPLDEAVAYAVNDIEFWRSVTKGRSRWPRIRLVFELDFRFDSRVKAMWSARTAREVRQVTLYFRLANDPLFGDRVTVDVHTWEEYVLTCGRKETHIYNKRQLNKIAVGVCNRLAPHFGWLDGEANSADHSYELLQAGQWPAGNDMVVVGPQLLHRIATHNPEAAPGFVCRLDNGGVILAQAPAQDDSVEVDQ